MKNELCIYCLETQSADKSLISQKFHEKELFNFFLITVSFIYTTHIYSTCRNTTVCSVCVCVCDASNLEVKFLITVEDKYKASQLMTKSLH